MFPTLNNYLTWSICYVIWEILGNSYKYLFYNQHLIALIHNVLKLHINSLIKKRFVGWITQIESMANLKTDLNHINWKYFKMVFIVFSCSIEPRSYEMTLRAQTRIKKGEEITVQYLSFMYGQCRRKKEIPSFWFFDCR